MLHPFDEERWADGVDPVQGGGVEQFPLEAVIGRLDGGIDHRDEVREKAATALKEVLRWIVANLDRNPAFAEKVIITRIVALAVEIDPSLLAEGKQARRLATQFGIREDNLSRARTVAREKFHLRPTPRPDLN